MADISVTWKYRITKINISSTQPVTIQSIETFEDGSGETTTNDDADSTPQDIEVFTVAAGSAGYMLSAEFSYVSGDENIGATIVFLCKDLSGMYASIPETLQNQDGLSDNIIVNEIRNVNSAVFFGKVFTVETKLCAYATGGPS